MNTRSGSILRAALALLAVATQDACFTDPGAEPEVQVTIQRLLCTGASSYVQGTNAVTIWIYTRHAADGGTTPVDSDAATDWDTTWNPAIEDRRAVYWTGCDPFLTTVQLPEVPIIGARFNATVDLAGNSACGGAAPTIIASGTMTGNLPLTPTPGGQSSFGLFATETVSCASPPASCTQ